MPHKTDMSSPPRGPAGRRRSSFRGNKYKNKRPFHYNDHRVSYNSVSKKRKSHAFRVNRNTTCPLLLRLFPHLTTGPLVDGTNSRKPEEYSWYSRVGVHDDDERKPAFSEFRLYTWKDATLNELYGCVTRTVMESDNEEMKRVLSDDGDGKGVVMVFSLVYPDRNGKLVMRQIGRISSEDRRTGSTDGGETLQDVGFEIGDFLDVAVLINADPS